MQENFDNGGDFARAFGEHLNGRYRSIAGALLTVAFDQWSERQFVTGRCLLSDAPMTARAALDYGSLLLVEEWIPGADLLARVGEVVSGRLSVCGIETALEFGNAYARQVLRDDRRASGWPEVSITCHTSGRNSRRQPDATPLVGIGLPPYRSWDEAVRTWVFGGAYREYSGIPEPDNLVFIIPDTRGRILSTEWRSPHLKVELELNASADALQVQVLAGLAERDERLSFVPESASSEIELPEETRRVAVYLVHGSGELLDVAELTRLRTHTDGAEVRPIEDQATADLAAGESEQVEYKPFIELNDAKWGEVVRSVVAFANTGGGRIYLGVRDDGGLEGEARLRKGGRADVEEAAANTIGYVRKLLADRVKPGPSARVELLELRGSPLIAIVVEAGGGVPYSTDQNEIFVRKGASNLRPDPRSELPLLLQRATTSAELWTDVEDVY